MSADDHREEPAQAPHAEECFVASTVHLVPSRTGQMQQPGAARSLIPSHPRSMLAHLEDAETGQADVVAFLQLAGGQRHQIARRASASLCRFPCSPSFLLRWSCLPR